MNDERHDGFHGRAGFGQAPALIVVDVNVGFTDPASPLVCDLEDVVDAIRSLLDEARRTEIPVVYTTVSYSEGDKRAAATFIDKVPALLTLAAGSRWVEIDPRIAPRADEPVLNKLFASAFFGTPLASLLASAGCDSLIVTRRVHIRLRAGDRRRRAPARLPADRAARGRRRSQSGRSRGEPVRHRREVRRRRLRRRRGRTPGGARWGTRSLRRSCSPTAMPTTSRRAR